jgi:hypothetical protein
MIVGFYLHGSKLVICGRGDKSIELGNEDEGCKVVGNIYHVQLITEDGQYHVNSPCK